MSCHYCNTTFTRITNAFFLQKFLNIWTVAKQGKKILAKIYILPSKVADVVIMQVNMVPSKSAKLNRVLTAKAGLNTA